MARRYFNHYYVRLSRDQEFKLSAREFNDLHARGWIKPDAPGSRYADLARGVVGWIRGGDLIVDTLVNIQTVTASWWYAWLYKVGIVSASDLGKTATERQEQVLFEQERERHNEALLWRTFRNTRGKNEFCWIEPETKAEILRALRPEAA